MSQQRPSGSPSYNEFWSNRGQPTIAEQQPVNRGDPSAVLKPVNSPNRIAQSFEHIVIMWVELNVDIFMQLNALLPKYGGKKVNERELYNSFKDIVYIPVLTYLLGQINRIVPRDSGRTRNALELSVRGISGTTGGASSRVGDLHPFLVVLNAGNIIDKRGNAYVKYANAMPQSWLVHPGIHHPKTKSYRFGRTVKQKPKQTFHYLNDPEAESDFMGKLADGMPGMQGGRDYAEHQYMFRFIPFLSNLYEPLIRGMNLSTQYIEQALFTRSFG